MQISSQPQHSFATSVLAIQNAFKKGLLERDTTALDHLKYAFVPGTMQFFANVNQSYTGITFAALSYWWGVTAKKSLKKILERLNANDSFMQMNLENIQISDKITSELVSDNSERHFAGLLSAWNMTAPDAAFLKDLGIDRNEFAIMASVTHYKAIDGKVVFYCRNSPFYGYSNINNSAALASVVDAGVEDLLSAVGAHKSFYALVNEGISLLGHVVGIFNMAASSQVIKGVDVKDIKFVIAERDANDETPAFMMPPTRTLADNNGDAVVTINVGNFDDETFVTQASMRLITNRISYFGAQGGYDFPKVGNQPMNPQWQPGYHQAAPGQFGQMINHHGQYDQMPTQGISGEGDESGRRDVY